MRVRLVSSLLAFSAVPAAVVGGARGAAVAIAVASALSAVLWWWQFLRRRRISPGRVPAQQDSLAVSETLGL
jgi:Na+-driven multidrug efflux pump